MRCRSVHSWGCLCNDSLASLLLSSLCNLHLNHCHHHEKVLVRTFSGRAGEVLWSLCSHLTGSVCSGKWGISTFVFASAPCPLLPFRSTVWGLRFFILCSKCRSALKLEERCLWWLLFIITYNPYIYVQFIGKSQLIWLCMALFHMMRYFSLMTYKSMKSEK